MKRKVRKFSRGGDILTALGAGLAGYGAYKYFTKDDQGKDTSTGLKAGIDAGEKANQEREDAKKAKKPEVVAEDKIEAKTDSGRNSARSPVEEYSYITKRSDSSTPTPVVKNKADKKDDKTTSNASSFTGTGMAGTDTGGGGAKTPAPNSKEAERQKFLQSQAGMSRRGITTPGTAKAGDKSGSTQKGRSENPIQGTIDNADKSMARTPQQKMAEGAREVERRRQVEKKKKEDDAYMRELERGKAMKKGGIVKKMASGGSVSSASKRADGIAIRGKTRA
jgi:hypothetical protein